ncbi:MAG: alpha/beta fold hydrolase [Marinilabiliaceae bacterium]|nr:alpha/beta fold hydrolase [Marinilabiliaceae bacterium]
MKLSYREFGTSKTILIIVHGLYGASDNWVTIGKQLSEKFKVFIIDQRNHGKSPHNNSHTYDDMRDDLLSFMDYHNIDNAHLIGHSMGGKTVLRFCLAYPERTDKVISVDIAPKPYHLQNNFTLSTPDHAKIISSMLNAPLKTFKNRLDIDNYLATDIPNNQVRQFLLKNITRSSEGSFTWKLNIKTISENLYEILDGFSHISPDSNKYLKPVFFIKGEKSNYILNDDLFYCRKYFPKAEFITIPNAGHWLHAEQPELFIKTALYLLDD